MDFHLLMTLLSRSWSIVAGAVTVWALPQGLDAQQQGYYFTFSSLLTLQMFFELGLGQIVVQLVSHEAAQLRQQPDGRWIGPPHHLARLVALLALMHRWYLVAGGAFILLGGGIGWLFFAHQAHEPASLWGGPWMLAVVATALNLWCSPRLAACEGLGQVGQVARLRLLQSMLGYGLLWLWLWLGWGLWCVAAVPLVSGLATWLWLRGLSHLPEAVWVDGPVVINWRTDIFPLQWRTATTWISWFFILNLFTPLTFSAQGPQEAGRLGMALTVFGSITTVGMSWVNAKFPLMGQHVARGEHAVLRQLFRTALVRALAVNALASMVFVALVWGLGWWGSPWVTRLAGLDVLLLLALVTVINTAVFSMSTYMRAYREEPMQTPSVVLALAVGIMALYTSSWSMTAMMSGYALLCAVLSLPWTVLLWRGYLKRGADGH